MNKLSPKASRPVGCLKVIQYEPYIPKYVYIYICIYSVSGSPYMPKMYAQWELLLKCQEGHRLALPKPRASGSSAFVNPKLSRMAFPISHFLIDH